MFRLLRGHACVCHIAPTKAHSYLKSASVTFLRCYGANENYRRSGFGKSVLLILGLTTVGGGGAVVYIRNDQEVQQFIRDYIPGGQSLVSFICRELKYKPLEADTIKQSLKGVSSTLGFGKEKVEDKPPVLNEGKKTLPSFPSPSIALPEPKLEITKSEHRSSTPVQSPEKKPSAELTTAEKREPETASPPASKADSHEKKGKKPKKEISDSFLDDFAKKIEEREKHIILIANNMTQVLKEYREQVVKLIDQGVQTDDEELLFKIREKMEQKHDLMRKLEKHAKKTTKKLLQLQKILDDEDVSIDEEKKEKMKKLIENTSNRITDALSATNYERSNVMIAEEYYNNLMEARNQLSNSLGMVFPQLNVGSIEDMSEEEMELFVIYAYRLIKHYQKELQKLEAFKTAELNKIYEIFKEGDKNSIKEAVAVELQKEKRKLAEDFIKAEFNLKREHEKLLKQHLRRQMEVYDDYISDLIELKEKETNRKLKQHHDEKIENLKLSYNKQLAKIINKMKRLENALHVREEAEKRAQRSQLLWNACQSLILSLRNGISTKSWQEQLKPLDPEVHSIARAAAKDDELVSLVISTIPEKARYRGVYSETALRDRFLNVEKVAVRLGNLPEGYASLFSMFMSYLQSILIAKLPNPVPSEELKNEPIDIASLNNYDILYRARYWIDRGDLVQTLRYMNLLKGASRAIADEWMNEVQIFLETQQAANTLLLYSVYSSLVYLQKAF